MAQETASQRQDYPLLVEVIQLRESPHELTVSYYDTDGGRWVTLQYVDPLACCPRKAPHRPKDIGLNPKG